MLYAAEDAQTALDETIDPLRTQAKAATIGAFETTESCRIVDLDLVPGMPSVFDDAPESRALLEPLGFLHGFRRDVSARIERDGAHPRRVRANTGRLRIPTRRLPRRR